jgi:hypothetical protein
MFFIDLAYIVHTRIPFVALARERRA